MSTAKESARNAGAGRFKPYPAYKDSGVEWLGEIPAHWEGKRLKNCVQRLESGGTPESDNFDYWTDDELGVPWVAISDMTRSFHVRDTAKRLTERGLRSKRLPVLPAGTLLYSMYASLGKVALLEIDAVVNQAILGLVTRDELVSRDYLRWWLEFMQGHVQLLSSSNTQDNLNADKVRKMPVFVPDSDEQRAIASFLDRETARIDALVAKKERLIALLEEQRTALITRAVTKGLDPTVPTKDSGVEWLGEIPAHWEVKPIRALARPGYKTFTDGDWIESPFIRDEGIRLIQTGNVGVGEYKEQGFRYIDGDTFRAFRCTEVLPGDVLICRLADPVGRACLAPDLGCRMITSVDVCILKPAQDIDPAFVVYALSGSEYLAWLGGICRGGTRDRVSRSMLGAIRVQKPPLPEQRAIAAFLDRETARIEALVAKVRDAIERLKELRTALISAAVTGKIDVREEVALDGSQITQ